MDDREISSRLYLSVRTIETHRARIQAKLGTVRTQAMQLWIRRSLAELGWRLPAPIVCASGGPLDTWADLSGLLEREDWKREDCPVSLAYFCGAMRDDAEGIIAPGKQPLNYLQDKYNDVKQNARSWLSLYTGELWPDAFKSMPSRIFRVCSSTGPWHQGRQPNTVTSP